METKQNGFTITELLIAFVVVGFLIIGTVLFINNRDTKVTKKYQEAVKTETPAKAYHQGTVVGVDYRPNRAEDGYYALTVYEKTSQKTYRIEATGYMNTPFMPEENGESCVNIPYSDQTNLQGATVRFRLPEARPTASSNGADAVFASCYKQKDKDGFFFVVIAAPAENTKIGE